MFSGISYVALFVLVILSNHHCCSAARKNSNYCAPSSCGDLHNISYPFRLNTDPESCGNKKYELACENNARPTLYFNMTKYYVQAINYSSYTIRIVDAAVQKDEFFSIPDHSFIEDVSNYDYRIYDYRFKGFKINRDFVVLTFITCKNPIQSHPSYIVDTSSYKNDSNTAYNSTSSSYISSRSSITVGGHSYVIVGGSMTIADLPDLCHVNFMYSFLPENGANMSFIDVHDILRYGFDLTWFSACCDSFKENPCNLDKFTNDYCSFKSRGPYRVVRVFLENNILRYLPYELVDHYLHGIDWIISQISGKGPDWTRTISSNLRSFIGILVYSLLLLLVLIVIYRALLFLCGFPCIIILLVYKWRRRNLSMYDNIEKFLQSDDNHLMPIRYSYSEIKKITNGFKDKLGEGGFGSVYKGKLRSGRFAAVKILDNSKANGQDFINEVATMGRIHHVNIMQLIGFTVEGSKRALIYDFMPNGSLEKYIFSRQGSVPLSNEKMYEISLGVAHGIEYLHQGCDMQILHFDIKPHNVLLDEKFVPKISDFGLAKLYPTNNNTVSLTAARGTIGYMAPELFYKNIGGVSVKVDVYSFGMLLLKMIGRRKSLNALANHSSQIYFPSWVYDQVSEGNDFELGDHVTEQEKETTKMMIIVALWCIQLKPNDRPSMHKVVEMLQLDVESLEMPSKPFLTPQQIPENDGRDNPTKLSDPLNDFIDSSYQFGR